MKNRIKHLLVLSITLLTCTSARAATDVWVGTTTNWSTASNWNPSGVPASADTATIDVSNPAILSTGSQQVTTLIVGNSGTGASLTVQNGATLSSTSTINIANNVGSGGTLLLTGAGSSMSTAAFTVGNGGTGMMTVTNGASFSTTSINVSAETTSTGTLNVSNGALFNVVGQLHVGSIGTGFMSISSGGVANSGDQVRIGAAGNGTLIISNGGILNGNTLGDIGIRTIGVGSVTITGANSAWNDAADVIVGDGAVGTLTLSNNGLLKVASGVTYVSPATSQNTVSTGTVYIGNQTGSTGTLNIGAPAGSVAVAPGILVANTVTFGAGTGTLTFNHTSTNYIFSPAITGKGTINILSGTTILSGNMSAFTGTITVDPAPGVIAGYTTPAIQQATVSTMAAHQRAAAIESRATANQILGMTRPIDSSRFAYAGAMLGSAVGYTGGQYGKDDLTLLGGFAYGAQDYPGIRPSDAPTIALALRYLFDQKQTGWNPTLRPFVEGGGWVTPDQTLAFSRPYANGNLSALGKATAPRPAGTVMVVRASFIIPTQKINSRPMPNSAFRAWSWAAILKG